MLTQDDRDAIDGLFERLAKAEQTGGPRDAEAEALIRAKIARQPAAPYYLAQTVVVQQQALNEAERKIADLEARLGEAGNWPARRGPWDRPEPSYGYGGGGFLAGAAQTALGVAGGVLLGSMIGSIFSAGSAQAAEPASDQDNGGNGDSGNDASDSGDSDFGGFDGGDGGFDMGGDF